MKLKTSPKEAINEVTKTNPTENPGILSGNCGAVGLLIISYIKIKKNRIMFSLSEFIELGLTT